MKKNTSANPSATVSQTSPFSSVVWLIPLLALITGAWLLIQHVRSTGPEITLYTDNAEGIEVNNTVIKVLNVTVGRVTSIKLRDDEKGVELTAQLSADVKDLMRQDTQFWIVKPRIDQSGITGLNTLVSGAYIAFTPGHSDKNADTFQLADLPPVTAIGQSGLRLRLQSHSDKMLGAGSPVLYGDINVGQVESASFNPRERVVYYQIYINSPNEELIGRDVHFWLQTGLKIEASGGGIKIDSAPLPALISGAIAFAAPAQGKGAAVDNNTEFTLYNSRSELDNLPSERALYYVAFFRQSVRGLAVGAPVEYKGLNIGTVAEVPYFERNDSHQLFANGWVPVRIRLEPARMEINASEQSHQVWQSQIQAAMNKGLVATLASGNLLTGNLYVELSDAPSSQAALRPQTLYRGDTVIGSRSGGLDALQNQLSDLLAKFNKLPLEQTIAELNGSLKELRTLLAQPQTRQLPQELNHTLRELQQTLQGVSPGSPLYGDVQSTLKNLDRTLQDAQPTLRTLKQQPNALIFSPGANDPIPKGVR